MQTKKPKPRRKPWWATDHQWSRMTGVRQVMLLGVPYELPVTAETEPFVRLLDGERNPWPPRIGVGSRMYLAERGIRDLIAAILVQVRDTVGHAVAQDLQQEISEKMYPLIKGRVDREIAARDPARIGRREAP